MTALLISVLACWRVTHLLHAEDGPGDFLVHLRRFAGQGFFGKLMDCFLCLSLWVAIPIAVVTSRNVVEGILQWLSISGGAILLERATSRPLVLLDEKGEEQ